MVFNLMVSACFLITQTKHVISDYTLNISLYCMVNVPFIMLLRKHVTSVHGVSPLFPLMANVWHPVLPCIAPFFYVFFFTV